MRLRLRLPSGGRDTLTLDAGAAFSVWTQPYLIQWRHRYSATACVNGYALLLTCSLRQALVAGNATPPVPDKLVICAYA